MSQETKSDLTRRGSIDPGSTLVVLGVESEIPSMWRFPPVHRVSWSHNVSPFLNVGPLASLIAGISILIVPRLLNYIVAFYLIIIGVLGLIGANVGHVGRVL